MIAGQIKVLSVAVGLVALIAAPAQAENGTKKRRRRPLEWRLPKPRRRSTGGQANTAERIPIRIFAFS